MKNSNHLIFNARSIGIIASQILSKDQDVLVFGKTSKGLFIKTSDKWLVFLSFEQFNGPLTITLNEIDPVLRHVSGGNPIHIASGSIFFPDLAILITIGESEVWQPPTPSIHTTDERERYEKLVLFAKEIMLKKKDVGLGDLIPPMLGLSNSDSPLNLASGLGWDHLQQIQKYIQNGEAIPLARHLSAVLGSGEGLTPSADDFVMGLLLTLNRWTLPPWTAAGLRDLNLQLVEAAYAKTTSLSANLIECATLGLADERLINVLDWLVIGVDREPEIVEHLMGWGNSSGVDAFVGMAVTLTV